MKLRPLLTLIVVCATAVALANQIKIKAVSTVGMILRPAVRADMKVTDEQANRLKEIQSEMQSGIQSMMTGGSFTSQEEVQEEVTRLASEVNQKALKVLTTEQLNRFKEIEHQLGGPEFFLRSNTIKSLSLKADQIEKIKAIEEAYGDQLGEIQQSSSSPDEKVAERDKLFISTRKKVIEVLTQEQRTTLEKLSGTPLAKK